MNNIMRSIVAAILGILAVIAFVPVMVINAWGGHGNAMAQNRVNSENSEIESMQNIHNRLDRSYFSTVYFTYGSSDREIRIWGVLTPETITDPKRFLEHIDDLREEISINFSYYIENSEGKVVQFEFHTGKKGEEMTQELLEEAFASPGEKSETLKGNRPASVNIVSINTATGEIKPGRL